MTTIRILFDDDEPGVRQALQRSMHAMRGATDLVGSRRSVFDHAASVVDAARLIGRDLAMTANVIKLVNSAFFGSRQPITTASRAVAYLGLDTLRAVVLGHSGFGAERYNPRQLSDVNILTPLMPA